MNRGDDPAMFERGHLDNLLRQRSEGIKPDVELYDSNKLLNTPVDDLAAYFAAAHRIEPIELGSDADVEMDSPSETTIETRSIPDGRFMYGDHQPTVSGSLLRFYLPFKGDEILLHLESSISFARKPRARIQHGRLVFSFVTHNIEKEMPNIKAALNQEMQNIRTLIQSGRTRRSTSKERRTS